MYEKSVQSIKYESLPEQHEHSLCCWWRCGWGAAAVAVAGGGGSW